jgi:hypothetical protein
MGMNMRCALKFNKDKAACKNRESKYSLKKKKLVNKEEID